MGDVVAVFEVERRRHVGRKNCRGLSRDEEPVCLNRLSRQIDHGLDDTTSSDRAGVPDYEVPKTVQGRAGWSGELEVLLVVGAALIDSDFVDRDLGERRGERQRCDSCDEQDET